MQQLPTTITIGIYRITVHSILKMHLRLALVYCNREILRQKFLLTILKD